MYENILFVYCVYYACVHTLVCVWLCYTCVMQHVWSSEDKFESWFSLSMCFLGIKYSLSDLCSKCFYSLKNPTGSQIQITCIYSPSTFVKMYFSCRMSDPNMLCLLKVILLFICMLQWDHFYYVEHINLPSSISTWWKWTPRKSNQTEESRNHVFSLVRKKAELDSFLNLHSFLEMWYVHISCIASISSSSTWSGLST